jgi:hypothetical protein
MWIIKDGARYEGYSKYRVTIKEIDTFNVIKTVNIVDTQFA